ncbi:nuclear transport factor 2 family protein [Marmoricola sp. URHB0036]|uniref:nuclear transport factor 2 family protein n=1 Tax=Marmoricola sp. URHB0036 TaxID=1298863 RepID=UPI0003FD4B8B|nr:nuclear transport factor 2 family protein [Marmoricola sp. URHB0036]
MSANPRDLVERLTDATNAHDLDAIVACFAPDYVNETPAHPERGFHGPEQVRRNWAQILGGVPDISARVLALVVDGNTAWSEWEMAGTRRDGAPHRMRGVIIFVVDDALIQAARFYLEPVDPDSGSVGEFVARTVAGVAPDPT